MINNLKFSLFNLVLVVLSIVLLTQCKKDDESPRTSGQVSFEITDAPIDNAEVKGAFVTVTDLKVDGKSVNLSSKQTIDILAYQNGDTKSLGIAELETGTYSNITLVLDYAEDQNGNSPGCYVLNDNGDKFDLNADGTAANEITFNANNLSVQENSNKAIVVDFDLRKAIKENQNNASQKYSFVSSAELQSSFRTAIKAQVGTIEGNCANADDYGDKVVIYAYKKGTYNQGTEAEGQGSSNITFKNSVTSAAIDANGNYSLHFLEAGEYEVHLIAYEDSNNDGSIEMKGSIQTSIVGSISNLLSLEVTANASLSVDITATGVIPL